jgi:protein-disulfide isomerase
LGDGTGGGRLSARARVVAGAVAAFAVLAVLAVAAVLDPGHPARVSMASRTAGTGGSRAAGAPPPGARAPSAGAANPAPSAHPYTGPAAPPAAPAQTLGRTGAPVTIVEFGDYQCTFCGEFARGTEPVLIRKYVDAGVARLVWRDFPWVDRQSVAAAVAARAAGLQGKFWPYHDYLLAHQFPSERSGLVTGAYLRSVARRLGLNMTVFSRDLADPALTAAVRADDTFGQQLGVPGTPAFLINGKPFFGDQPLAAFEAAIAQARRGQARRAR